MAPAVHRTAQHSAQDASLDGHAPLPHKGDFSKVLAVIAPVKEEHVPQPGPDESAEAAVDAEVRQVFLPAPAIPPGQEIGHRRGHENGGAQHQAVHPHRKIADKKQILMHSKVLSYTYKSH